MCDNDSPKRPQELVRASYVRHFMTQRTHGKFNLQKSKQDQLHQYQLKESKKYNYISRTEKEERLCMFNLCHYRHHLHFTKGLLGTKTQHEPFQDPISWRLYCH